MEITKAHWASKDGRVSLSMPFNKVDTEQRTVSGYASVDNLDTQGDVVTAEAASEAFDRFRGNIREMHQPIAVGKVVSFWQQPLYDTETNKTYVGVYVTAYVSTGAQDTWEKVLDGTLTGFSIGGSINDAEDVYDNTSDTLVRVIKSMDLHELSLVDNPANQLANVVSIQKVADGDDVASGIAVNVETENVYWCGDDQVAVLSKNETAPGCFSCEKPMENIGWIESDADRTEKMRHVVNSHISKLASGTSVAPVQESISKGGVDMTKETEEVVVDEVEKSVEGSAEQIEEVVTEEVEKSEESVVEDAPETLDTAALIADLKTFMTETVGGISEKAVLAASEAVDSAVAKATEAFDSKIESLESTITTLKGELATAVEEFGGVAKRIDAVESETAIKKSGELGRESDQIKKSLWAGSFLTAEEL